MMNSQISDKKSTYQRRQLFQCKQVDCREFQPALQEFEEIQLMGPRAYKYDFVNFYLIVQ